MNGENISRRDFLKTAGTGALALGAAATGCGPREGKVRPSSAPGPSGPGTAGMAYRTDPHTGAQVSLLGYGCMRWPMTRDADGKEVIDQEKVNELVDHAIAHGVNYFDTSPVYLRGESEKATGIALARHPRDKWLIATKLSNFGNSGREASIRMYEDSFRELQTDWFDYYLLHSIGRGGFQAFLQRYSDNGMIDFLLKERESGRIRNLGFSFHGSAAEFDELMKVHDRYHVDFVQIEMNYIDWKHADGVRNANADYLYEQLDQRGIPIVVMEPLLGGRLAGVPDNIAARFKERDPAASAASWAFRFVGTHPRILTVLSGMTYMDHLVDNLKTFEGFVPLTDEELEFMEEMAVLMKEYPTVNCTNCQYCMPCPYGIDIPGIFAHYNRCIGEGIVPQNPAQEGYKKLRKAYLASYNKAIPTLRQADHCIGCRQCMVHCPQSIAIPEELHRIDRYIERLKQGV